MPQGQNFANKTEIENMVPYNTSGCSNYYNSKA